MGAADVMRRVLQVALGDLDAKHVYMEGWEGRPLKTDKRYKNQQMSKE